MGLGMEGEIEGGIENDSGGRGDGSVGIVAFAFGTPHFTLSNQCIAEIAMRKALSQGEWRQGDVVVPAPIYTQRDIQMPRFLGRRYRAEEREGNPPPTLRIARGAIKWAKQQGVRKLWVVAAKPHLWRCIRDLKYAIREADAQIKVFVCGGIRQVPENKWFDPDSTQERVRSFWKWWPREIILRLMPMFIYRRVAS